MKRWSNWYLEAKETLSSIILDGDALKRFINFEIFDAVCDCFEEVAEGVDEGDYILELIMSLFEEVKDGDYFDVSLWNEYVSNKDAYNEFKKIYSFPQGWNLKRTGTFWLKYMDRCMDKPIEENVKILSKLIDFYNWIEPYCTVYSFQYFLSNPSFMVFAVRRLSLLQYWEYKEVEEISNEYDDIDSKIEAINRFNVSDYIDDRIIDRESLLIDFVSRGIPISEALKMVKMIRCGRSDKLSDSMKERLYRSGYSGEAIQEIMNVVYLKSRRSAIIKLLFTTKLIKENR